QRAALHQAARHHEGEVQADRHNRVRLARRRGPRPAEDHALRGAGQAQQGRDGEGRGRAGCRAEAERPAVKPHSGCRSPLAGDALSSEIQSRGIARKRAPGTKAAETHMSKILVIAEHLGGKLNSSTARAVSAAAAVKGEAIDVLVLADSVDAIAAEAAKIDGVSRVLTVARAENAHPLA